MDIDQYKKEAKEHFKLKIEVAFMRVVNENIGSDLQAKAEKFSEAMIDILKEEGAIVPGVELRTREELTSHPGIQAIGEAMSSAKDTTHNQ